MTWKGELKIICTLFHFWIFVCISRGIEVKTRPCKFSGAVGDPWHCRFYYGCTNGQLRRFYCGSNAVFDSKLGACVVTDKKAYGCVRRPPPKTTPRRPEPEKDEFICPGEGFFSHPDTCKKFYRCTGSNKRMFSCPNGMLFDKGRSTCNIPSQVKDCQEDDPGADYTAASRVIPPGLRFEKGKNNGRDIKTDSESNKGTRKTESLLRAGEMTRDFTKRNNPETGFRTTGYAKAREMSKWATELESEQSKGKLVLEAKELDNMDNTEGEIQTIDIFVKLPDKPTGSANNKPRMSITKWSVGNPSQQSSKEPGQFMSKDALPKLPTLEDITPKTRPEITEKVSPFNLVARPRQAQLMPGSGLAWLLNPQNREYPVSPEGSSDQKISPAAVNDGNSAQSATEMSYDSARRRLGGWIMARNNDQQGNPTETTTSSPSLTTTTTKKTVTEQAPVAKNLPTKMNYYHEYSTTTLPEISTTARPTFRRPMKDPWNTRKGNHNAGFIENKNACTASGVFADPDDCSVFYQCGQRFGVPYRVKCNGGLVFSRRESTCDWPYKVPECADKVPTELPRRLLGIISNKAPNVVAEDDAKTANTNNRNTPFEPVYWARVREPLPIRQTSEGLKDVLPTQRCVPESYRRDPFDCQKFYICGINQKEQEFRCPMGLGFDDDRGICVSKTRLDACSPESGDPDGIVQDMEAFRCPHNMDLFANPRDCQQFYDCDENGRASILFCPEGFVFNSEKRYCDFASASSPCKQRVFKGETVKELTADEPYEGLGDVARVNRRASESDDQILNALEQKPSDSVDKNAEQYGSPPIENTNPIGTLTHISQMAGSYRGGDGKPDQMYSSYKSANENVAKEGGLYSEELDAAYNPDSPDYNDEDRRIPSDIMKIIMDEMRSDKSNGRTYNLADINERIPLYVPMVANAQAIIQDTESPLALVCPGDGFMPHPTRCDRLVLCRLGQPVEYQCNSGLYFNDANKMCDDYEFSRCDKSSKKSRSWEIIPANAVKVNASGDLGPLPLNFMCLDSGRFRHPYDCRKFFVCGNGPPRMRTCPQNMIFNSLLQTCVVSNDNDACEEKAQVSRRKGKQGIDETEPELEGENYNDNTIKGFICPNNGLFPDKMDCRKFYHCDNGLVSTYHCTTGYAFDVNDMSCLHHSKSTSCDETKTTKYKMKIKTLSEKVEPIKKEAVARSWANNTIITQDGLPRTTLLGNNVESSKMLSRIQDVASHATGMSCDQESVFLDPRDCRKFYHCQQKQLYQNTCPPGTLFNRRKYLCDDYRRVLDCLNNLRISRLEQLRRPS